MPFVFECPHCHASTEVDDRYAGETGPCFSCGKQVQMPAVASDSLRAATQLLDQKRSSTLVKLASATAVALAVLAITAASLWFIIAIILPRVGPSSPAAQRAGSAANLQRIAAAMQAYHDDFGCYPPARTMSADGVPMHSWRVLLLPYLGHNELYSQYRMDEPWDSTTNARLFGLMPEVYASPADDAALGYSETSYMVIVGNNTLFPRTGTRSTDDLADGAANTILVVEVRASGINWLEPVDLIASRMRFEVNGNDRGEIGSQIPGGALVVTADGQTHFLPDITDPQLIQSLSTPRGGEGTSVASIPNE